MDETFQSRLGNQRIRFDRNELAGSFGDIGADLPLIVGMILATDLDSASVLTVFGLMQIFTGLVYGLPMPVQPLKAMAVLVITQKLAAETLFGAGLAIGATMLLLSLSGALGWLSRRIPDCVVRGIQFGLGLSLASLGLKTYVPSLGAQGYLLAGVGFILMLRWWGNRRVPAGLVVIGLGALYAVALRMDTGTIAAGIGWAWPRFHLPTLENILTGFLVLSLPQLPLSLSNSVIATAQTIKDLFPKRSVSVRRIGVTYGLMNLFVPFFSGIPVCHGCGGLAGHYAFGARTGGSVILYGSLYIILGLAFSRVVAQVVEIFPQPILGVVLLFEALTLLLFIRDQVGSRRQLTIALIVALLAFTLPQGYVVGLLVGTSLYYLSDHLGGAPEISTHTTAPGGNDQATA